ncbi:hypothetical protein N7520_003011 [Penicillium odoratum]|uniref:uncharacterized protein n=1 Tax=Penicillium odoratum TaxID=1167516 RepID=UPI00254714F5|nr:uncharacterized protein N7520_003011 [Penicillium odoratum]KAJ5772482.1 hypothetical protein N7520_003011 [Penicillium odoratum]
MEQRPNFATFRIIISGDTTEGKQAFSRREPDTSFGNRQAHYHGITVEVCYSQKSRHITNMEDGDCL